MMDDVGGYVMYKKYSNRKGEIDVNSKFIMTYLFCLYVKICISISFILRTNPFTNVYLRILTVNHFKSPQT